MSPPRTVPRDTGDWRSRGQALAELALITPVLLLLVLGAIDVGRLFAATVDVTNAAKEGAFFAASSPGCDVDKAGCGDPNNVAWHVDQELSGLTGTTTTTRCVDGAGNGVPLSACAEGFQFQVTVAYPFRLLTPLISSLIGDRLTLSATANAAVLNASPIGAPPPPVPAADFRPNPASGPAPLFVQFQDLSTNNPSAWQWDFGDGSGTASVANPSYTYTLPGVYSVTLVASNAAGPSLPVTHTVTVAVPQPTCQAPTLSASVAPSSGQKNNKTVFTFSGTSSQPAATWSWDFGDGTTASGIGPAIPDQDHTYKKAGTYTGVLTVTTGATCATTTVQNAPSVVVK